MGRVDGRGDCERTWRIEVVRAGDTGDRGTDGVGFTAGLSFEIVGSGGSEDRDLIMADFLGIRLFSLLAASVKFGGDAMGACGNRMGACLVNGGETEVAVFIAARADGVTLARFAEVAYSSSESLMANARLELTRFAGLMMGGESGSTRVSTGDSC